MAGVTTSVFIFVQTFMLTYYDSSLYERVQLEFETAGGKEQINHILRDVAVRPLARHPPRDPTKYYLTEAIREGKKSLRRGRRGGGRSSRALAGRTSVRWTLSSDSFGSGRIAIVYCLCQTVRDAPHPVLIIASANTYRVHFILLWDPCSHLKQVVPTVVVVLSPWRNLLSPVAS